MQKKPKPLYPCLLGMIMLLFAAAGSTQAAPPLSNPEGAGGCALNPFAYVVGAGKGRTVSNPQLGIWNIGLTETDINWTGASVNVSLMDRVELGYGHEFIDIPSLPLVGNIDGNVDKDNISIKVNLVPEGFKDMAFVPAVSAGLIWKTTDINFEFVTPRDTSSVDYYLVATKMIGGLPVPVILNAGLLSTNALARGVLGYGDERDIAFFGNIETVVMKKFIVGWEYEQGTDVGKAFKGSDTKYGTNSMWEAHVAYMHNENLMLVGSYAYTGDKDKLAKALAGGGRFGFGGAYVVTLQYAF